MSFRDTYETPLKVKDEGITVVETATSLDFTGAGVTATGSGSAATADIPGGSSGSGTVTDVSVVTANGLSGTVANSTTTPAITLDISGLDATKIANGSVTSTEFQYLDGVTSSIQTQLNGKQASGNYITALTGDATASGPGSVALTLATVNSNVGTFGSATKATVFTVNGKGLITAASETTITPAVGSITGLGTGVATALAVNVGTDGAFVVKGGALGTPASGVATNLTGTASGLTAGAVTNATFTTALTVNGGTLTLTANVANTSVLTIGAGAVSVSGSNTGDQTITLTGAVTGSGTGSFATTFATPGTLSVSSSNSNANAHTHAITSSSAPGAVASLLATDSSGIIGSTGTRIVKIWATDLTVTNAISGSITGNAATVTTNANLTGPITSSGNATSIASQTGTGTKFVVDTSPTLVTPNIGVAQATSLGIGAALGSNASRLFVQNSTQASGYAAKIDVTQTTPNASDTNDGAMYLAYNISASSATNELVSRVFRFDFTNTLTGGGVVSNARLFNLITYTATGSTITTAEQMLFESGLANGTITTNRIISLASMQGTNKYLLYDAVGTQWVNASGGLLGIGTLSPDRTIHGEIDNATTNAVTYVERLTHTCSGTVTTGFGVGQEYELENASGTNRVAATHEVTYTDAVDATEDATYKVRLIRAGTLTDAMAITSVGAMTLDGVAVPTISSTSTLTNKRITKRLTSTNAPGATPTSNTDSADIFEFTGLATAITSMTTNLSGTPVNGDMVEYMFLDNGTARAITWGASFANGGLVNLPTTTVISTMLRVLLQYQTTASLNKWVCIAVA